MVTWASCGEDRSGDVGLGFENGGQWREGRWKGRIGVMDLTKLLLCSVFLFFPL